MPLDFTAIDFETANGFWGSPCALGMTRVRDGLVVEEDCFLIRPPAGHDHFDPRNIAIHGIHPHEVAGEPRFHELFPRIQDFIGDDVVVAHNAAFDLGVIEAALRVSGERAPRYRYACTVVLSRRCYSLPSNSLPFAAHQAGVPLINHHDPAEDARACAGILVDIATRQGADSVAELYQSLGMALPQTSGVPTR